MQAAAQIVKGELLFEMRAKNTATKVVEITPFGTRLEMYWQGTVSGNYFSANAVGTTDLFVKNDGTVEWEARHLETTKEGDILASNGHGTSDIRGKSEGESVFMTRSPRLSFLNGKNARIESAWDLNTGDGYMKAFAL